MICERWKFKLVSDVEISVETCRKQVLNVKHVMKFWKCFKYEFWKCFKYEVFISHLSILKQKRNIGHIFTSVQVTTRGVARIFGLGGQTMSCGARPCEHRSFEAQAGGLGPPPEEFCWSECLKCIFPASGTITITYRTMKFNNLHQSMLNFLWAF